MLKRAVIAALAFAVFSCAPPVTFKTEPVKSLTDINERFNLIYYVGTEREDIRRAVVLDVRGDEYEFIPSVEDFEYEILQDIPIWEAIYETKIFFGHHWFITTTVYKRILNLEGRAIGYELRPLYHSDMFRKKDVIAITYTVEEGNRVSVEIKLEK
jgi:hypothetical protein